MTRPMRIVVIVEVGAFREAVDFEDVGVAEDAAALFAEEAGFHAAETVEAHW
jgi:hypothetical protein